MQRSGLRLRNGLDRIYKVSTIEGVKAKVSKWGNSLALRLPKALLDGYHISEGSDVEIVERKNGLLLTPVAAGHDYETLIGGIDKDNLHSEVPTGERVGGEAW